MKRAPYRTFFAVFGSFLLSSCYEVNHPLVHRALWSEFIPLATVEKELPQLQKLQLSVFIAIHEENPDYDGFAHLY
ncbi:hypothetical protein, partial [Pseudomonas sp. MPR-AND1A]|uniref:hypothetical protein n=1 Tax=Pseudomonas sp. MPR-AND1A TaxID=2070600 RepID=UPI0011AED60A